ncbi:MAG: substrate-binding domain-containing protein [Bacteroides sp.]|nr:substrate-binding domain-containing protein [Bacteroides sp.]
MKYITLLILLVVYGFTSCRQESARYVIGVSQCSDDEWRHQMNQEIRREADFYGVQVEIRNVKDDNRQQESDIRYFIDKGVDLLVISPNEAAPLTPIVEEAYDKGIPVIVVDRKIISENYTAYIGADNYEVGKAVGNYIVSLLQGKGTIAEITGLSGSTSAMERHQGLMSAIHSYPEIRLLCREDAGWLEDEAEDRMDTILSRFPQIDILYAQNDRMASGAYKAARRQGRNEEITFIGVDALPGKGYGIDRVLQKELDATFIYPTEGDKVVQLAMDILEGREFARETILHTAVVDQTNARVMNLQTRRIYESDRKVEALNQRVVLYLERVATQRLILFGSLAVLILVAGLLLIVYRTLRSRNRLNRELSEQKIQLEEQRDQLIRLSQQLEEATHAKLVFFTNISHDFRTPLTLVADPIDQVLSEGELPEREHRLLKLARKNVTILLRLVNQILDFRKYENGKTEFHPLPVDLLRLMEGWNESFRTAARRKHIRFSFDPMPDTDFLTMADPEKLERIYFNLLSNAFKFTPENGKVTVTLSSVRREDAAWLRFTVANTGDMISPEHIRNIFERFYKIDRSHSGSGIGLALVKAFVDMHGGTIEVESDEKTDTVFAVELPVSVCETEKALPVVSNLNEELSADVCSQPEAEKVYEPFGLSVLTIDDNADIRSYIAGLLRSEYSVLEAADAAEGIRKAMKYVPDVILLDVMMPGMDGIECCRRLKSELQTCHIPIILLTACAMDEERIQGYDGGADSFISKPFNSRMLLSRIRNLLNTRHRLKQFFGDAPSLAKEEICDIDKEFVEKFNSLIGERMSDSSLNVEDLGRQMGLSRVQLYRKIKSLTNYAPNELLRMARLKKAAALLASSDKSVSEIGYEVGFSSPSYFAKCYKEQYGESPTDFLRRRG